VVRHACATPGKRLAPGQTMPSRLFLSLACLPLLLAAACTTQVEPAPGLATPTGDTQDHTQPAPTRQPSPLRKPLLACSPVATSTLPGVHIDFHPSQCEFDLAQARAGITIDYDLVVDHDVIGFAPAKPYWYGADAANLVLDARLAGGSQAYCLCDQGLPYPQCPTSDGKLTPAPTNQGGACGPITVPAGVYHRTFTWDGVNWDGPSDTDNPKGAAFPAGDYTLTVATGTGSIGTATDLGATASLVIRLIP
jgi:hypothetical protein